MSADTNFHRSTDRILSIFEYLTETENAGKTLTEIASCLDAPKSSILPMLRTLVSRGYLHYNPLTFQYFLGYKLYEVGTKYVNNDNVEDVIYQIMQEVASACGVSLSLGELVMGDVLFLQKVDLFEKLRLYKAVGRRLPAYSLALGKVLLCEKEPSEIEKLYPDGLTPITPKTITDFPTFFEQLAVVRQVGFASSIEEATMYVRSVALPIRKNGTIVYGLEASFSILEYTPEKEREILFTMHRAKVKLEDFLKNQPAAL